MVNTRFLCGLVLFCAMAGCCNTVCKYDPRPAEWATPDTTDAFVGMNLHQVDASLYRGAQPTADQVRALHAMGVKTIVNLRETLSDADIAAELGMKYVAIPMSALDPRPEHVLGFLKVMSDPANHPVFLHCAHGADRTGLMTAIYRVVAQGWEKDEAIREFTQGGQGFNPWLGNLVRQVRGCDADSLRQFSGVRLSDSRMADSSRSAVALGKDDARDRNNATVTP